MKRKYLNLLTLFCLVVCLALSVGVAYGRYQWEFPDRSYSFTPEVPDNIFLCGSLPGDWLDYGVLPELQEKWLPNEDGVKLDFGVTNGNSQQVSQKEQSYSVRLAAGLAVTDPEDLTVILYWWDDADEICWAVARASPIQPGSALQASYGDGWEYRFYEDDGTELDFTLPGGQLAYENHAIAVFGEVASTLLDVQVVGQNT